ALLCHPLSYTSSLDPRDLLSFPTRRSSDLERSVGVDVPADVLDFLRDLIGRSGLCALEKHVLENVGQARAQVLILVNASRAQRRSEEHTSELQSLRHLVCRLLLEKKKKNNK